MRCASGCRRNPLCGKGAADARCILQPRPYHQLRSSRKYVPLSPLQRPTFPVKLTTAVDLKRYINPRFTGTLAYRTLVPIESLRARNPRHRMLKGGVIVSFLYLFFLCTFLSFSSSFTFFPWGIFWVIWFAV